MEMNIPLARTLIQSGLTWKEVKERTGITQALYGQIKRELKPPVFSIFGCRVCCGPILSRNFCKKHYTRYLDIPNRIKN